MKETIALLNKLGHNIITREFTRKYDGYTVLYIVSVDGTKYATGCQKMAREHVRRIVEEEVNGSENNK